MQSAQGPLVALLAERGITIPLGNTRFMDTKPKEATDHGRLTSLITSTERWFALQKEPEHDLQLRRRRADA